MKKVILTFGLFSMMVLTSFSTKPVIEINLAATYDTRGASIGAGKKLDIAPQYIINQEYSNYETGGGASIGAGKKLD